MYIIDLLTTLLHYNHCSMFDILRVIYFHFHYYLIYLFAHIGYNPIEQHNILAIHVNYIKNNILEKKRKKEVHNYSKTGKKGTVITLHTIYNGVN